MRDSVIFCKVDSYGFPHWNGVDFLRWKTLPTNWRFDTGTAHLWIYKTAWLVYHRNMLKKSAEEAQIPLLLLAGVAAAEVGGTPERFKSVGVLQVRQILETISRREDKALSKEGANKQVISSQADSLIKISRIWADFFPA
ncbi:hypothetical protein QL288_24030, partial [Citrobacter youngae]|nr:hypothetical protein [Citrobacter youngae]